jgi:hypothetical protein
MESEAVPLPPKDGKKKHVEQGSLLSSVGKTWHAGKGEGGVREGKKRQEWGWEVSWAFRFGSARGLFADLRVSSTIGSYASLEEEVLPVSEQRKELRRSSASGGAKVLEWLLGRLLYDLGGAHCTFSSFRAALPVLSYSQSRAVKRA